MITSMMVTTVLTKQLATFFITRKAIISRMSPAT